MYGRGLKYFCIFFCVCMQIHMHAQTWYDLTDEGMKAYASHNYDQAITYYDQALKIAVKESGKQSSMYTASLNNLGQAYREKGEYKKSEDYLVEALGIMTKTSGKNNEYANVLSNLGALYKLQGKYEESYKDYLEAFQIMKKICKEMDPRIALFINNLAGVCTELSKYKEAELYYLQVIKILETNYGESHPKYIYCISNLASLYDRVGNYADAGPLFAKAIDLARKQTGENSIEYAKILSNAGGFALRTGDYDQAEACLIRARNIFDNTVGESTVDYIYNLNLLGTLHADMHNWWQAEYFYLEAADTVKKIYGESNPSYPDILSNLAMIYDELGDLNRSESYFLQSIDLNKKLTGENDIYYAIKLRDLGTLYSQMNRNEEAEDLLVKSLDIIEKILGKDNINTYKPLTALGHLYMKEKDYKKAEQMYLRAFDVVTQTFHSSHYSYLSAELNLANIYMETGEYGHAMQYIQPFIGGIQYHIIEASSFMSSTELYYFLEEKLDYLYSFASFETKLYKQFPGSVSTFYNFRLLMDGVQLRTSTTLKRDILNSNDTTLVADYKKWIAYKLQISEQYNLPVDQRNPDMDLWQEQAYNLEKNLMRRSEAFKSDQQTLSYTYKDVKSHLLANEASIDFISFPYYNGRVWTDSILYAAALLRSTDSVPVYIPLFEEKQLKGLLQGDSLRTFANLLYTQAQVRHTEHDISYGDSLYQLIWQPIEPYLQGTKKIFYSPSGLLHNLSMDAIPVSGSTVFSDKYALNRLTAMSKLIETDSTAFNPTSVALFGGIQYDVDTTQMKNLAHVKENPDPANLEWQIDTGSRGGSWSYLPGTKKEVETISTLLIKNKITTQVYTGVNGTEEAVKSLEGIASPSILHFSTHGFFFPDPSAHKSGMGLNNNIFTVSDEPLQRSGLIFSGGNYVWKGSKPLKGVEDGILTAYEVSNLYLPNTKLVVMSACETGLGDIGAEGVYGLQRAFKMAGVDYIIVSLWQVLDKETSDFMTLFYENLLKEKSIPQAFKTTQDWMKNKYRDEPYKWAGFVLIK